MSKNVNGGVGMQAYQFSKKEQPINCERCVAATAIKKCLFCKMSLYC